MHLKKDGWRLKASSAEHNWSTISLGDTSMGVCIHIKITSSHSYLHITDYINNIIIVGRARIRREILQHLDLIW